MTSSNKTVLIILAVVLGGPILLCSGCLLLLIVNPPPAPPKPVQQAEPPKATPVAKAPAKPAKTTWPGEVITSEEFSRINIGMTYEEVAAVIGSHGEEISRTELGGITTIMMMWKNTLGSNANVMFQDGKAMSKAQFALPSRPGSEAQEEGELTF